MRPALLASILAMNALFVATAHADVGQPPTCEAGTHHEYLFGHHCVPNGSHLEKDPEGGIKTVGNAVVANKSPPPALPSSSSPPAPPSSSSPPALPSSSLPPTPLPSSSPAPASSPASPAPEAAPPPGPTPSRQHGCACGLAEAASGGGGTALGVIAAFLGLARRRPARAIPLYRSER